LNAAKKKTLRVSRVRVEIRYNGDRLACLTGSLAKYVNGDDMLGTLIDAGPDREDYALYA
jgi:hypothetical protein